MPATLYSPDNYRTVPHAQLEQKEKNLRGAPLEGVARKLIRPLT